MHLRKSLITIEGLLEFMSLYRVKIFFGGLVHTKQLFWKKSNVWFFSSQPVRSAKIFEKIAKHGLTREALSAQPFDLED
jgi:hypothetical protein